MSQLGLSFTRCGLLMSVFFVVSGVGQALAGFVVDRAGPLPVLLSGIGALACAAVLLGWSTDYHHLLAVGGEWKIRMKKIELLNRDAALPSIELLL